MSEWEEFCESKGMNAGSEDDYDRMLNELDEPDDRPALFRGPSIPPEEITPTVGKDELIACLIDGVVEGGLDVHFAPTYITEGEYHRDVLDGLPDQPRTDFYFRLRSGSAPGAAAAVSARSDVYEHHIPTSFLIEALRESGAPLLCDEGWWVAWDDRERCLKTSPDALEFHWRRALANKPIDSMDERELDLMRLLNRAILSTDHGKKPLLVEREYVDDTLRRREVEFATLNRISPENLERFALAFYDAAGEPRTLPMKQVAELGFPISTRSGTLIRTGGDLVPYLSEAQLIAGAFLIATKSNPNELKWFLARDRGSIFHSAIEQIEAPKAGDAPKRSIGSVQWRDPDRQIYLASNSLAALDNAKRINEWATQIGTVYVTSDWHPLDSKAVTTPKLYEHAIATLTRSGYEVSYSWSGAVQLRNANGAKW